MTGKLLRLMTESMTVQWGREPGVRLRGYRDPRAADVLRMDDDAFIDVELPVATKLLVLTPREARSLAAALVEQAARAEAAR